MTTEWRTLLHRRSRNSFIAIQSNFHRPTRNISKTAHRATTPAPKTDRLPSSRLERLESRLPKYLRRYTTPLRQAPISHVTPFLILHEITAVLPLFGLAGFFHYTSWIPLRPAEWEWGRQGIQRFDRWARRKGWVVDDPGPDAAGSGARVDLEQDPARIQEDQALAHQQRQISPIVLELAVAWAVTKALLPVRLMASVWATPWFAERVLLPCTRAGAAMLGRGR